MTEAMKWVTLFWPLPWNPEYYNGGQLARWGDVVQLGNACGCLFWASMVLLLVLLVHGIAVVKAKASWVRQRSTLPHRLAFGNWESRCLHWLAFPVAAACGSIFTHPFASVFWKATAGGAFVLYFLWALVVFIMIRQATASKNVIWVWHSNVRDADDDGELLQDGDEAGYWSDSICDQLLTQPVNRSLFKWFFPWRWVATVADIVPVSICPKSSTLFSRQGLLHQKKKTGELRKIGKDRSSSSAQQPLFDGEDQAVYSAEFDRRSNTPESRQQQQPLGKNPKVIEILRTTGPSRLCPGRRLVAGLFRTQWIDTLFTYEGLTKFHSLASEENGREFTIPLTVKTCQLTGPLTGGSNHFFYDGTRIPFIRIGDALFRLVIGLIMGIVLGSNNYKLDACLFGAVGLLSMAMLVYHLVDWPYTRRLENWILGCLLLSVASTSFAFLGYSVGHSQPSVFADLMLWLSAAVGGVLASYACVVIFSVYSAVMCPPLEETRFLEQLANCAFTISDHEAGWAVELPAYIKSPARDLKAQCNISGDRVHVSVYPSGEEVAIEVDTYEMLQACLSGNLRLPILSLFCPDANSSLGYRHTSVYDKSTLRTDVAGFVAMDRSTRSLADAVAKNIEHQVQSRGAEKTLLSFTIVPPRKYMPSDADAASVVSKSSGGRSTKERVRMRSGYTSIQMSER